MKIRIKRTEGVKIAKGKHATQFYFRLEASNGQVLMTSETYKRKPTKLIAKLSGLMLAPVIDDTLKK